MIFNKVKTFSCSQNKKVEQILISRLSSFTRRVKQNAFTIKVKSQSISNNKHTIKSAPAEPKMTKIQ